MKYITTEELRVRAQQHIDPANVLGKLAKGAIIEAEPLGNGWAKVAAEIGGAAVLPSASGPGFAYVSSDYLAEIKPPVQNGRTYLLGAHCRDDGKAAEDAIAAGVKLLVCMNGMGKVFVRNLAQAHPDVTFIYRRFLDGALPSPETMVASLEVASDDPPNLLYVGINEADGNAGSLTIKTHAEWDTKVATLHNKIRKDNGRGKYLAWSAGHGNPPALDSSPEIQAEMRKYYAPGYNSGLYGMDMHDYTAGRRFKTHPPANAGIVPTIYYERRWTLFFTHCGFDPAIKNMWSTETGVEAGQGGFAWAGYNEQQFDEWCEWICSEQSRQLPEIGTYDGQGPGVYDSPYRGGSIFQIGDSSDGRWAGFNVRGFIKTIGKWSKR